MAASETFGKRLEAEIDAAGISLKELARRVAADTAVDPESVRRLIYKHLSGAVTPGEGMRRAYAVALGRAPDFFLKGATLSPDGYCVTLTGEPLEVAGLDLARWLREGARRDLRRAREIEEALAQQDPPLTRTEQRYCDRIREQLGARANLDAARPLK